MEQRFATTSRALEENVCVVSEFMFVLLSVSVSVFMSVSVSMSTSMSASVSM